jgi:hypothetical protein
VASAAAAAPAAAPAASTPPPPPPPAQEQPECCLCLDAAPVSVGVPCGHVAMCTGCACAFLKSHRDCPACAAPLEAVFVPGRGLLKPSVWGRKRGSGRR